MKRVRVILFLGAVALAACGAPPLEFADWTIAVPEGVPVHEYAPVPLEGRSGRIEVAGETIATDQGVDAPFEAPVDLTVDAAGLLYVLDGRARQVRILSPDGELRGTLGRRGQGPGELMRPVSVAVVGDRILVIDQVRGRLVSWTVAGELSAEIPVQGANAIQQIRGGAGTLVGVIDPRRGNVYGGASPWSVAHLSLQDGSAVHLVELDYVALPMVERTGSDGVRALWPVELPAPNPLTAVSPDDTTYVAPGAEYQVAAYDADGSMRWALRVAGGAPPLTEEMVEAEADRLREHFPDLQTGEIPRPDALAAVNDIAIDGHGHLYVFPYFGSIVDREAAAVDVYSAQGERLFSGRIDIDGWLAAHGDAVFRIGQDEQSGARQVVRYHLVEPF